MTRDPFPGMAALPGTQNPYVYALNNPATLTDPSGKFILPLILGGMIGGGIAAFMYWQSQPCSSLSSLLRDPGFWQATFIGAAAGAAGGLVAAGVFAFGAGAFGGSIWGSVITGAVAGGLAGGVGEAVFQLLTYGGIRNPQLVGGAMLSGVVIGGVSGAIGYGVGRIPNSGESPSPGNVTSSEPNRVYSDRELARRAEGPYHNFPESFDEVIFGGKKTVVSDNYAVYRQPGSYVKPGNYTVDPPIPAKIVEGTYEIGVEPSGDTEVIIHRFFRPNKR